MKRHCIDSLIWLFLFCGIACSCSEDFPVSGEAELNGLVMQLQLDGMPVSAPSSRIAADPTLRENVVEHVDVFFSSDGTTIDYYKHAVLGTDNRLVLAGADWKTKFPASSYTVYVLANKHDYEDSDKYLSEVKTVEELKRLTDRDDAVNRAEDERISDTDTYTGKLFFMDGKITWTPPTDQEDETIEVELERAAAKFVVNISFVSTDDFKLDEISITSVQKKVVHYMPEAVALAEVTPDYAGLSPVEGDASSGGFSIANHTTGKGEDRKDILYAYSYPNDWGEDAERETYLLINVPYSENDDYHNNYYKVPIRFSSDISELHIDRNTQYTVNVTVDRKGNEEIDEPVKLSPTFNIAEWETKEIAVEDDTPNYLVLSDYDIEMHNEEEVTIQFFSSSDLSNVTITDAYFIDKNGNQEEAQNYYSQYQYQNGVYVAESNVPLSDLYKVEYDENTLTGTITFTSKFVEDYLAAVNITARYYTLSVSNGDGLTQTVQITQYPLEYISGVPGVYSTRSDFETTGNTYLNYKNHNRVSNDVTINTGGWNPVFQSKVFYNGGTHYVIVRNRYLDEGDSDNSLDNNRMYLVQITSTDRNYIVARPQMDGSGENIVTHSSDENNRLVSPAFMLASQLGAVLPANWNTAQTQCQQYVEWAKYPDGVERRFADWRLPTYEELRIIGKYQNEQPEVMDEVLGGDYYWSAYQNRAWRKSKPDAADPTDYSGNNAYIRCIRDVSPDDLAEFRAHNIR